MFNAEDGLSLAVSCGLYARSVRSSPAFRDLKEELARAFADQNLSWKELLSNERYEVVELETEDDAKAFAHRILIVSLESDVE
ncbi:hypothetical protein XcuCFBP2542_09425 [Xanthomonas cucurbitae]|uniref:Uncharacterized protein n=2 Tax=Xanthomonas TaxID=338 RepID=A0A2S7DSA1_9XANT|nr:hypothetical protein XcuCFBP2542_09425 [Xanthomonas cucurbitae]QHG85656.1 hypothetical protein EBN15_00245 [Xanthomonas cucurbitae]